MENGIFNKLKHCSNCYCQSPTILYNVCLLSSNKVESPISSVGRSNIFFGRIWFCASLFQQESVNSVRVQFAPPPRRDVLFIQQTVEPPRPPPPQTRPRARLNLHIFCDVSLLLTNNNGLLRSRCQRPQSPDYRAGMLN